VCSVWVPCVALPSGGGSSVGPSPLCGSPVWVPCAGPLCVGPLCGSPLCGSPVWVPCVGPSSCCVSCGIYSRDVSRSFTRSRLLGTPVGKKNSQRRLGGPSHAKYEETGQTGAQRADLRRQAPEYDEYARIPSRRRHRIEHIAWSTSMRCCPARRAVPNVQLRTSAASDLMQVETCIMSIRMLSIPAADMLKVACLAHRPSSYRSMSTRRRLS